MKKIYILFFGLHALALRAQVVYQEDYPTQRYSSPSQSRRYQYRSRMQQKYQTRRKTAQRPGESLDDFCRKCCAQGRTVSKECCIKCSSCQSYSDEAVSECRDYPL